MVGPAHCSEAERPAAACSSFRIVKSPKVDRSNPPRGQRIRFIRVLIVLLAVDPSHETRTMSRYAFLTAPPPAPSGGFRGILLMTLSYALHPTFTEETICLHRRAEESCPASTPSSADPVRFLNTTRTQIHWAIGTARRRRRFSYGCAPSPPLHSLHSSLLSLGVQLAHRLGYSLLSSSTSLGSAFRISRATVCADAKALALAVMVTGRFEC